MSDIDFTGWEVPPGFTTFEIVERIQGPILGTDGTVSYGVRTTATASGTPPSCLTAAGSPSPPGTGQLHRRRLLPGRLRRPRQLGLGATLPQRPRRTG